MTPLPGVRPLAARFARLRVIQPRVTRCSAQVMGIATGNGNTCTLLQKNLLVPSDDGCWCCPVHQVPAPIVTRPSWWILLMQARRRRSFGARQGLRLHVGSALHCKHRRTRKQVEGVCPIGTARSTLVFVAVRAGWVFSADVWPSVTYFDRNRELLGGATSFSN